MNKTEQGFFDAAEWGAKFESMAHTDDMIHVVYVYGGDYEDAYERVIGAYTDKDIADKEAIEYDAGMKATQARASKEYEETDFDDELPEEEYMRISNAYYSSYDYSGTRVKSYELNKKLYEEA